MLELTQIESFYPDHLKPFKKALLREYLQYKILEIVFDSPFGLRLVFMGGTALHLLHGNPRFSEDLDFDNLSLNPDEFGQLSIKIEKRLKLMGYQVKTKNKFKSAYHSYIQFSSLLYEMGLSPHKDEKLLIQIDTEPQRFHYVPDKIILNKFDVFTQIPVVPVDLLLAQKLTCIFKRRRMMGRDFFDAVFLLGKAKPNFDYLKARLHIKNKNDFKKALLSHCAKLNFKQLANDVEPFLFNSDEKKKVLLFREYIKNYSF